MRLKEKSIELIMSIPHIAFLWNMRRHQRYEPREGLDIEVKLQDAKIYAILLDICIGGMRIVSTDNRVEDLNTISLSVDDFHVDLPCRKIRKVEYHYGIIFEDLDAREISKLEYFIDHYTKEPLNAGLTDIY